MLINNIVSYDTKHLFAIVHNILWTKQKFGVETISTQKLLINFTNNYRKWQSNALIKHVHDWILHVTSESDFVYDVFFTTVFTAIWPQCTYVPQKNKCQVTRNSWRQHSHPSTTQRPCPLNIHAAPQRVFDLLIDAWVRLTSLFLLVVIL